MILHHFAQQRLALLLAMKKFFYKKNAAIFILLFRTLQNARLCSLTWMCNFVTDVTLKGPHKKRTSVL